MKNTKEWVPMRHEINRGLTKFEVYLAISESIEMEALAKFFNIKIEDMFRQGITYFLLDPIISAAVGRCPKIRHPHYDKSWKDKAMERIAIDLEQSRTYETPGSEVPQGHLPSNCTKSAVATELENQPPRPLRRISFTVEVSDDGFRVIQSF